MGGATETEKTIEKIAIEKLRRKFPNKANSWIRRAITRFRENTIRQLNENTWIVDGDPKLGDKYLNYIVHFKDGRYHCSCFESSWGPRRKNELCTHIAAVILHREYSKLLQPIYAAIINMECEGDYHFEVLDKEVKVIKQVKALSSDAVEPRYRVTYVLMSNDPRTVKVRYACKDEANEREVVLSKTMRYMVELLMR
ncbi:hypothetical protein [Vulcanisaeta souniana]|uniref:SWIM-type domain-containing protein n=1 Tax=Vulcanisaeta souniana JCM 11219 TaxID=1293586 RepID=A0A830E4G2_9CREN|nr:hypothetical protein [Vulcanisaeta souniana]BDR92897.1 hypothetical protein Vsou_19900 [Vulcanisaeta souniana JCM 11219]GGI85471.1 hypothetical protein GCM10007112_23130 [Vulcanisaeta souniana JCM 11219]